MRYVHRLLERELSRAAKAFPALLLTGARRAGKTTLFRKLFPKATYCLLEDPDVVGRFRSDPRTFLDDLGSPAILDEIQHAPEILNYVRTRIDRHPRTCGRWLLTGSQEAPLMRGVTESMAGRAAVFQLMPLSTQESPRVTLLKGGFPEVLARSAASELWFRSYLQTYLERDVRALTAVRSLPTFRRFLSLLASRTGQWVNRTDLAAPLGVSIPTISEWLNILEITEQIILVPPYYENFGKRIVKSPKLYFTDSGLVCHLLGIGTAAQLKRSPFRGAIFEGFIAAEILKHQINTGKRRELYTFRDRQGLEVDLCVPLGERRVALVEAKASGTAFPEMANSLIRLRKAMNGYDVRSFLVYDPAERTPPVLGLAPGVKAISARDFLSRVFA